MYYSVSDTGILGKKSECSYQEPNLGKIKTTRNDQITEKVLREHERTFRTRTKFLLVMFRDNSATRYKMDVLESSHSRPGVSCMKFNVRRNC